MDKHTDGSFALKTLKQKLFVDGLCYLIQEIYGVERKSSDEVIDEEIDDTGTYGFLADLHPHFSSPGSELSLHIKTKYVEKNDLQSFIRHGTVGTYLP